MVIMPMNHLFNWPFYSTLLQFHRHSLSE